LNSSGKKSSNHFAGGHPSNRQLRQFATGKLEASELDRVADHIASCDGCSTQLEEIVAAEIVAADDTLLDNLKEIESAEGAFELAHGGSIKGASASEDALAEAIERESKYQILRRLGSGGMGAVFLAEHKVMDRKVAIKVIRHEYVNNPEAVLRFRNEVRSAARLSHRNIVTAFDAEQVDDTHFLVMEYVVGESLSELVNRRGPLPVTHACNYALQVAHGLKHAHENRMAHRDIKPSNLMCSPKGAIKILDFGLARILDTEDSPGLTTTGVMMGTADYIAPEQARDAKSADIRSDLYSLGCTMFYMLAGRPPFEAETKVDKVLAHCTHPLPDITSVRDDIPDAVIAIMEKLTAKSPEQRFQSPKELIDELLPFGKPKSSSTKDTAAGTHSANFETAIEKSRPNDTAIDVLKLANDQGKHDEVVSSNPSSSEPKPTARQNAGIAKKAWKPWAVVIAACLLLAAAGVSFFVSNGGFSLWADPDKLPNDFSNSDGTQDPTVLIVMSSTQFWFADYAPLEKVFNENGIEFIVTADRAGEANYNPSTLDPSESRRSIPISKSIEQWVADDVASKIDAVVFIGTSTHEFCRKDAIGVAVEQLLSSLRQQEKWVTSVGLGSLVPMHHGFYVGANVSNSTWLERHQDDVDASGAIMVDDRVSLDEGNRILTCCEWTDSRTFALRLVQVLHDRKQANK